MGKGYRFGASLHLLDGEIARPVGVEHKEDRLEPAVRDRTMARTTAPSLEERTRVEIPQKGVAAEAKDVGATGDAVRGVPENVAYM